MANASPSFCANGTTRALSSVGGGLLVMSGSGASSSAIPGARILRKPEGSRDDPVIEDFACTDDAVIAGFQFRSSSDEAEVVSSSFGSLSGGFACGDVFGSACVLLLCDVSLGGATAEE